MSNILEKFGNKVKIERISRGLSKSSFAKMLNLDLQDVEAIENGKFDVSLTLINSIFQALEIKTSEFFKTLN